MEKKLQVIGLSLGWFAIFAQFYLMLQNRVTGIPETIIRFFSFFTILTNILVALYYTVNVLKLSNKWLRMFHGKGTITALTVFIGVVGLVYQVVLRHIWEPTGLQWLVDELLHTVLPLYALAYWYLYATTHDCNIRKVIPWLLYPIIYVIVVLFRGAVSDFYPYPFLNISEIGLERTGINIALILALTLILMLALTFIGRKKNHKPKNDIL